MEKERFSLQKIEDNKLVIVSRHNTSDEAELALQNYKGENKPVICDELEKMSQYDDVNVDQEKWNNYWRDNPIR
jgi:hypothetical protein